MTADTPSTTTDAPTLNVVLF
ncbi:MAG: hypothetical protein RLZZ217_789, partial [Planctomycetota bacterium]